MSVTDHVVGDCQAGFDTGVDQHMLVILELTGALSLLHNHDGVVIWRLAVELTLTLAEMRSETWSSHEMRGGELDCAELECLMMTVTWAGR